MMLFSLSLSGTHELKFVAPLEGFGKKREKPMDSYEYMHLKRYTPTYYSPQMPVNARWEPVSSSRHQFKDYTASFAALRCYAEVRRDGKRIFSGFETTEDAKRFISSMMQADGATAHEVPGHWYIIGFGPI